MWQIVYVDFIIVSDAAVIRIRAKEGRAAVGTITVHVSYKAMLQGTPLYPARHVVLGNMHQACRQIEQIMDAELVQVAPVPTKPRSVVIVNQHEYSY